VLATWNLAPTRQASGIHAWTSERAGYVTSLGRKPLPDPIGGHRQRSSRPEEQISAPDGGGHGL